MEDLNKWTDMPFSGIEHSMLILYQFSPNWARDSMQIPTKITLLIFFLKRDMKSWPYSLYKKAKNPE